MNRVLVLVAGLALLLSGAVVPSGEAIVAPPLGPQDLVVAMVEASSQSPPPNGSYGTPHPRPVSTSPHPNGVGSDATGPVAGFPRDGGTYAILTTGIAALADAPDAVTASQAHGNSYLPPSGDPVYDFTRLDIEFDVQDDSCSLTFDYRFLTEETSRPVGGPRPDVFVAEFDADNSTAWSLSAGVLSAPSALASEIATDGSLWYGGGVYNAGTDVKTVEIPVLRGFHWLNLSIADAGDGTLDSAVFLDALSVVCPTYPPGEIGIYRRPGPSTDRLRYQVARLPAGWTCYDYNYYSGPLSAGSPLKGPGPHVYCENPPDPPWPRAMCRSYAAGAYSGGPSGTMEISASCASWDWVTNTTSLPPSGGSSTRAGIQDALPFRCRVSDINIWSNPNAWFDVFCRVNG